jgi:hypothetical protein
MSTAAPKVYIRGAKTKATVKLKDLPQGVLKLGAYGLLSYLIEAPDSGQDNTILECLHIVSVPLYHSRVATYTGPFVTMRVDPPVHACPPPHQKYTYEAQKLKRQYTILECLHIVSVPLYHSRVTRSLIHPIIVCLQFQSMRYDHRHYMARELHAKIIFCSSISNKQRS